MSRKLTNINDISLPMAVWLLNDEYDYNDDPAVISTTTLLQPIRSLVLKMQNKNNLTEIDISSLIPSKLGTAVHDSLEKAWSNRKIITEALELMGMGSINNRIVVNPETVKQDDIPIYVEQRVVKEIGNWKISGKYDLILDGTLKDYKTTSVWAVIFGSNSDQYIKQGSIYRWLNPDKITEPTMNIEFLFTDWSGSKAKYDKSYPQLRVQSNQYPLMPIDETERFIISRITLLDKYKDLPQVDLPQCTPEELWQKPSIWKYYKNPAKMTKSTKNYEVMEEAYERHAADGGTGIVKEVPGEVKRCIYCDVNHICSQAELLIGQGLLEL